eukprot:JP445970.1.p1 GENE.JP445970.1~~JP445970.1.p1  ORF type:complete len:844 (-),score=263.76 JP445970.1:168-2465(-)
MITIPPRKYLVINNPVARDASGEPLKLSDGTYKLRIAEKEIRFQQPRPFPLYPGETMEGALNELQVVQPDTALKLRANTDFTDGSIERSSGDEWLFKGPATYFPRVEVDVSEEIGAVIVNDNQALRLRADLPTVDVNGTQRYSGEEWLVRTVGAYLPQVTETVVAIVSANVLTPLNALHLRAMRNFTDIGGKTRLAAEEWLVTYKDRPAHIPDVYEKVVGTVAVTVLSNRQFVIVLDPYDSKGVQQLGSRELRKGPCAFFLLPGERMEAGIQDVYVLNEDEALLLRAKESFMDVDSEAEVVDRKPGSRWMIHGPRDYFPSVEVEVIERRKTIPLDHNEGIYIRDVKSGCVRIQQGQSYLLKAHEELWEKTLPDVVEELLVKEGTANTTGPRDKTRMVSFAVPQGSAVQVYDYKNRQARVVFGPDLAMLLPDEHFTVLSLSGGKPKRSNHTQTLLPYLGPDFITDIFTVETSDHARLSLRLSYNRYFDIAVDDGEAAAAIFQVPDFVGDVCKSIASRVRGAVASVPFDTFHKNSADVINTAVFGKNTVLRYDANHLVVTSIDIQAVDPVDDKTRTSLQKSVQLAIDITTQSQEAAAKHDGERREQQARGQLERQQIKDQIEAEKARIELLQLQAESAAVESRGQAIAEAKALAETSDIDGDSHVYLSKLKAQGSKIEASTQVDVITETHSLELEQKKQMNAIELKQVTALAEVNANKMAAIIGAIGTDTLQAMAEAGPEVEAQLLEGLGLSSILPSSGANPLSMFQ